MYKLALKICGKYFKHHFVLTKDDHGYFSPNLEYTTIKEANDMRMYYQPDYNDMIVILDENNEEISI